MTDALYKITAEDGSSVHGGYGKWPLPTQADDGSWTPGDWREVDGRLSACKNALHFADSARLSKWLAADCVIWEAEAEGEVVEVDDKLIARRARLIARRLGPLTAAQIKDCPRTDDGVDSWLASAALPRPAERLVFGLHRQPAPYAETAPAWPPLREVRSRGDRKFKRLLKGAAA